MKGKIMVSAEFPHILERKARIAAAVEGVSRSELIRRAVEKFVRDMGIDAILAAGQQSQVRQEVAQ